MGKPAARVFDYHSCPLSDGPKPHVGGPILAPGCPTVLIGGQPAARVGDMATCVGPPDILVTPIVPPGTGSGTVLIGGQMAARKGDRTLHGGVIRAGCETVLIGQASTVPTCLPDAKTSGSPGVRS